MPEYEQNGNGELPPHVRDLLTNWPPSGSGDRAVHRHLLKVANRLRHYVDIHQAQQLIVNSPMPRPPKRGEIEEALEKAYNLTGLQKSSIDSPPDHLPNLNEIENVVAERIGPKSALKELEERSGPIPAANEILQKLFPADCLICVARAVDDAVTLPLAKLQNAEAHPWIVPSPMSAPYSIDDEGRRHRRSLANTGPRRFIIVDIDIKEFNRHGHPTPYAPLIKRWQKYGVTLQDAAAALLRYLAEYGPLAMVTFSGNISLQGWFFCAGEDESEDSPLRVFFESAVVLGADRAGWTRCQFFRMPGATHPGTKRRQSVHFFNPEVIA
jgi:hypothetical protein